MKKGYKVGDLVIVQWEDSAQPLPSWRFLDDIEQPEAIRCQTVGWLVAQGQALAIAQNMGNAQKEDAQVSGVMRIPRRCVISIKKLPNIIRLTSKGCRTR